MKLEELFKLLVNFTFFYPLAMSYVWMLAGLYYRFHWESKLSKDPTKPPPLPHYPLVTILVPCHNEGDNARETIGWAAQQKYPNFEIIAINDGSKDNTGEILDEIAEEYDCVRVLHLATNQGKAMGLRMGALASKAEYLLGIDGDALLDPYATHWFMYHMVHGSRVGAVTGNPRIRTRSSILGKLQVGEFSSIIGLIKRAQRIYGRVFTVSGVIVCFRRAALHEVGYWSIDMVTEDIDVSWRLQLAGWDIRYEPNSLCWILMPETLNGLWKQRLRWAQGGSEVLLKYFPILMSWRKRSMWPVFAEYTTSVIWAYCMASIMAYWFLTLFLPIPDAFRVSMLPQGAGLALGLTCLIQFMVSMYIDSRYEKGLSRYYTWMVWYPLAYWLLTMLTTVVALPKALTKRSGERAVWDCADRGIGT